MLHHVISVRWQADARPALSTPLEDENFRRSRRRGQFLLYALISVQSMLVLTGIGLDGSVLVEGGQSQVVHCIFFFFLMSLHYRIASIIAINSTGRVET